MQHDEHAQQIVNRFREMVEEAGDSLPANHYGELALLIEAGIDSALFDKLGTISAKLNALAHDMEHDAEFFD